MAMSRRMSDWSAYKARNKGKPGMKKLEEAEARANRATAARKKAAKKGSAKLKMSKTLKSRAPKRKTTTPSKTKY